MGGYVQGRIKRAPPARRRAGFEPRDHFARLYCPSYSKSTGDCVGKTPYANPGWAVYVMDLPLLFAGFAWWDGGYGPDHWYKYTQYGASPVLAKLEGKADMYIDGFLYRRY